MAANSTPTTVAQKAPNKYGLLGLVPRLPGMISNLFVNAADKTATAAKPAAYAVGGATQYVAQNLSQVGNDWNRILFGDLAAKGPGYTSFGNTMGGQLLAANKKPDVTTVAPTQKPSSSWGSQLINSIGLVKSTASGPGKEPVVVPPKPQSSTPGMQIKVPDKVPSSILGSTSTQQDVMDKRSQLDAHAQASDEFYNYLLSQGSTPEQASTLSNMLVGSTAKDAELATANADTRSLYGQAGDYFKGLFGKDSVKKYNDITGDAGLGDQLKLKQESDVRLAKLQGELTRIRPQIETEAGQTRIGAEARLSPVERNLRAEIASEALVNAAYSGNVKDMREQAKTIMDLESADEKSNISSFENRIKLEEARVASLSGEAKAEAAKRLDIAKVMLDDRKRALDAAEQNKKDLISFALDYAKQTGDGAGAASIINSGSLSGAVGQYGGKLASGSGAKARNITSGALQIPATDVQELTQALNANRGEDGHTDTKLYVDAYSVWLANGGLEKDFFEQFPPVVYVNPKDKTVPQRIKDAISA